MTHCTRHSCPGDLAAGICAPLLLLVLLFKTNSMHLMLQVHKTETKTWRSYVGQGILIQKVQSCTEFSAHRWTFSLGNYEKQLPLTWLRVSVGPVCWTPFIMITLSLWVRESVLWVSLPNMCGNLSVQHWPCVEVLHKNNIRETCKGYSLVRVTALGKRSSARSFRRLSLS